MANIKVGDPIPLRLKLSDKENGLYVRAKVQDSTGTAISGSPFTLTHDSVGFYKNISVAMPDVPWVGVVYEVFTDSGFSTPSNYADVDEVFARESQASFTLDVSDTIVGTVTEDAILGTVLNDEIIIGEVESTNPLVTGTIETEAVDGEIEPDDIIIGEVTCS